VALSLPPPATVGKLQAALHRKAKESPAYRFYALYDKVYRGDVLAHAYARCRANGGAAGVDGQTFAGIQEYGEQRWLEELALRQAKLRKGGEDRTSLKPFVATLWVANPTRQGLANRRKRVLRRGPVRATAKRRQPAPRPCD